MTDLTLDLPKILAGHAAWRRGDPQGTRADLRGANLRGANLRGANLSDANLSAANLSAANLSGANLSAADLRGANLRGANLRAANLSAANLRDANLRGANLRDANLRDADLRGANLSAANLRDADLRDADLRSADLRDADLRGAKGVAPERCTPLLMLLDQPGAIRAYKLVNDAGEGPFWGGTVYAVGETVECGDADTDASVPCGAGINVATLDWCLNEWQPGYRILIVEFVAADIAAIPTAAGGKFRLHRCHVVAEKAIDPVALGLVRPA